MSAQWTPDGKIQVTWPAGKRAHGYDVHVSEDDNWTTLATNRKGIGYTHTPINSASSRYVFAVTSVKWSANISRNERSEWTHSAELARPLSVSDITVTTATLTLNGHSGNWWLKGTHLPDHSCTAKGTAKTHNITNLYYPDTYTYTAYLDGNCLDPIPNAAVTFRTADASLAVSNLTSRSATLAISGWVPSKDGDWYYKQTSPSVGNCSSGLSTATVGLSTLSVGTQYTYKAYGNGSRTTSFPAGA